MTLLTWFAFVIAARAITISPGSGAVLSMSHGLAYGVRRTTATIAGLQAGLVVILLVAGAGIGIGSILVASELAFSLIMIVGASYLVYLGIGQWRTTVGGRLAMSADGGMRALPSWSKRFSSGFLTNATNPKGIVFMVAVLPQFIAPNAALLPQLLILATTMCMIDVVVMHGYALAAASMQRHFSSEKAMTRQNRFFGGVLIGVGAALFFVERSSGS